VNPNRSSNSSSVTENASGWVVIGMLSAVGIWPVVESSEGSRVSVGLLAEKARGRGEGAGRYRLGFFLCRGWR
jgi:hypothetical protein